VSFSKYNVHYYFDNNATVPLSNEAKLAWLEAQETSWANPSSLYSKAIRVSLKLDTVRQRFAEWLHCEPTEIVFCSGTTEANNAVFKHFGGLFPSGKVVLSPIEHPSVRNAANVYFGQRVVELQLDTKGVVCLEQLEKCLKNEPIVLCSVMAANNDSGVIQPVEHIAECCRNYAVPYHCDSAQWVGKLPITALSVCDFLSFGAHKFGATKGIGILKIVNDYAGLKLAHGGLQENAHRAGTEDYPAIAAMLAGLEAQERRHGEYLNNTKGRDYFESVLVKNIPGIEIVSQFSERLWNTSLLLMPQLENTVWITALDKRGFEVSSGSACTAGKQGSVPILSALGIPYEQHRYAVRVSGSYETQESDWASLANAFTDVFRQME